MLTQLAHHWAEKVPIWERKRKKFIKKKIMIGLDIMNGKYLVLLLPDLIVKILKIIN